MTVLVTGASGYLGKAVVATLLADGDDVRTLQRRPSGVAGAQDFAGSVTERAVVAAALDGADAVIHLAAKVTLTGDAREFDEVNVGGTETMLAAAEAAGVRSFVQVSSPSVAHAGSALVGVGAEPADPTGARGDYARTKALAEIAALSRNGADMRVVAVRPHLVWGPGDPQLVERIVDRARRGRLPLLDGGTALIDTTYIDNAAEGIIAGLRAIDSARGKAYVITNGEPRPVAEMLANICLAAGVAPPRWSVPAGLARTAGGAVEQWWKVRPGEDEPPMTRFLAEQLSTAHWFDQRDVRRDLAWTPRVTLAEGFERLRAHYAAR
ncbi:nucleoside-diphosphate-sugar epimerase [Microbacterium endophyticum]|uniref:Nucleoside-diphosphate-sugar epimerase n=1 Tax=Microbacterium endophyticum TaxID=1526412 RepID=A0A7W4V4U0_9MICO|nr:NAD-dependent epimerase/dehydratase family protein [Microbacterium endophyticum]MBB2976876.1 nucleoside-diphosphate-sugar epimerase [Microbacterium endophyticum]NIK35806.1 nucleoside-diphosphate-sugar epimerase [Microbacterium endophyticum]